MFASFSRLFSLCCLLLISTATAVSAGQITMIHHFKGNGGGAHPVSDLLAVGSMLYGTTQAGGANWSGVGVDATGGTLFRLNPATGKVAILHSFGGSGDGAAPAPEALAKVGTKLYGATMFVNLGPGSGAVYAYDLSTHLETVLHTFSGFPDCGAPLGGLVNLGGILYGTTSVGGQFVGGCIYKIDPATGHYSIAYSFSPVTGAIIPKSGLTAYNGSLYGTTSGTAAGGTLFQYTPSTNTFAILHTFAGGNSDGSQAQAKPIVAGGMLYGATGLGGSSSSGTLYRMPLSTKILKVLHSFGSLPLDGLTPSARLVDVGGILYGTASQGGNAGFGIVYSYNLSTKKYAISASFVGSDGATPLSGVTPFNSLFYGLADGGGPTAPSYGTLYSFTP